LHASDSDQVYPFYVLYYVAEKTSLATLTLFPAIIQR